MSLPLVSWKVRRVGMLVMMSARDGMHWDWRVYVARGVKGNVKLRNRRLRVGIGVGGGGGLGGFCSITTTVCICMHDLNIPFHDMCYASFQLEDVSLQLAPSTIISVIDGIKSG